jgi:hypothetical protein
VIKRDEGGTEECEALDYSATVVAGKEELDYVTSISPLHRMFHAQQKPCSGTRMKDRDRSRHEDPSALQHASGVGPASRSGGPPQVFDHGAAFVEHTCCTRAQLSWPYSHDMGLFALWPLQAHLVTEDRLSGGFRRPLIVRDRCRR